LWEVQGVRETLQELVEWAKTSARINRGLREEVRQLKADWEHEKIKWYDPEEGAEAGVASEESEGSGDVEEVTAELGELEVEEAEEDADMVV
jgi:hypothetical protein